MTTSDAARKPEVSKLAKLLGDDSGDSEWDVSDEELDAEFDDPLEKEPIWVQVILLEVRAIYANYLGCI